MEAFEGSAADLGSPASPEVLGSTQKLATFKASKAQQDALGSGVVTTPVRRSCRKEKPAVQEEDALETSGFAFAPNKFMMPEDDEVSSEGAVSEGEFAFECPEECSQAPSRSTSSSSSSSRIEVQLRVP